MPVGKLNIDSLDLSELQAYVDSIPNREHAILSAVRGTVFESSAGITNELRANTPVETGAMRENWAIRRGERTGDTIASVSIRNTSVQGVAVELGVAPGDSPWPSPTKGRGRGLKRRKAVNERTVLSKGRIWSTQAIGGITPKVISKSIVNDLTKKIADSVALMLVR